MYRQLNKMHTYQNPTLRWILKGFDERYQEKIESIQKTWSPKIRNFYRDFMGLRTSKKPLRVEFPLDDNGTFIKMVEQNFPELDLREYLQLKNFLAIAQSTEGYFKNMGSREALAVSIAYANERVGIYDIKKIVETLFPFFKRSPEADIFGRYYLYNHRIKVYTVPCILFSMIIEAEFLDFTVTTLAHELAHGFCHAGEDKDGHVWDGFENVDTELVESLAEFYTREFVRHYQAERPGLLFAFEETARYLPPAYNRYREWDENSARESIYQALIRARRTGVSSFDHFTSLMLSIDDEM